MTDFSKDFEKYLNLYLDNRLEPDMADQFEKYLADNPELALELDSLQKIDTAAKSDASPDLPEGYWEGLHARIDTQVGKIATEKLGLVSRIKIYLKDRLFHFVPAARIASITLAILTVALISRNFIGDFHVTDMVEAPQALKEVVKDEPVRQSEFAEPDEYLSEDVVDMQDEDVETTYEETIGDAALEKKALEGDAGKSLSLSETEEADITAEIPAPVPEDVSPVSDSAFLEELERSKAIAKKYKLPYENGFDDLSANARVADSMAKELFGERKDSDTSKEELEKKFIRSGSDPWSSDGKLIDTFDVRGGYLGMTEADHPEIVLDEAQSIEEAKKEKSGKGMIESSSMEGRPGEAEMDTTLYLKDGHEVARNADDLVLTDFPQLSWDARAVEKKSSGYNSAIKPKNQTVVDESVKMVPQDVFLKNELDSVIILYNLENDTDRKINYFREIVDRAFELTKIDTTEDNLRHLKKLINQALSLGIIDQEKYEEYKKDLPILDRIG